MLLLLLFLAAAVLFITGASAIPALFLLIVPAIAALPALAVSVVFSGATVLFALTAAVVDLPELPETVFALLAADCLLLVKQNPVLYRTETNDQKPETSLLCQK